MNTGLRPAVFLDRDGTLLEEPHYLANPSGVILVSGAIQALATLREAGFTLVVVTNQSGIASGLYSERDYRAVASRLNEVLEKGCVPVDATKHCPHDPELNGQCACRKPGTAMHKEAAAELGLDLGRSWCIGDKVTDVLPATKLGGQGILVRTGYGREQERRCPRNVVVVDDLAAAARVIVGTRFEVVRHLRSFCRPNS